jgi:DNA polymerase-4
VIWGNVTGERFLRELQGKPVVWPDTRRGMIGHGQVLTEGNKTPEGARLVARRLLVKAAARLRREGFFARSLSVGVKCAQTGRQGHDGQIKASQDTFFLLETLDRYWLKLKVQRPKAVHVTLGGLIRAEAMTGDLFDPPTAPQAEADHAKLCKVVDALNQRFGQDTVRFGQLPPHRVPYTGAKIAFGRIPVAEDFRE